MANRKDLALISFTLEELEVLQNALDAESLWQMRNSKTYGKGTDNPDIFHVKALIANRMQVKAFNAAKRLIGKLN